MFIFPIIVAPNSAPINITIIDITSREFSVVWTPPSLPDQNGVIRSYVITLIEEYSGSTLDISVEGNVTSFDFQDLHPAYTYALEIAAVTISQGPNSDVILVKTAEDGWYAFFPVDII